MTFLGLKVHYVIGILQVKPNYHVAKNIKTDDGVKKAMSIMGI